MATSISPSERLWPCEFCGELCLAPENEPIPWLQKRGSRCEACAPGWIAERALQYEPPVKKKKHYANPAMPICGVYTIQLRLSDAFQCPSVYIGSSVDIQHRFTAHGVFLRKGIHHNKALQSIWNAYGEEAFEFVILKELDSHVSERDLRQAEWEYMRRYPLSVLCNTRIPVLASLCLSLPA
jgi:hypothetical protein